MNAVTQIDTTAASGVARAPYKVDASAGGHNGEVSKQWMSRPSDQIFNDLNDLYDAVNSRYENAFESRTRTAKVEIIAPEIKTAEDFHRLTVGVEVNTPDLQVVREVAPTNWSFAQLCQLGKAPASYLRELPSPLVSDQLNYRLRYAREVEEIKLYGGAEELYAATGPTYGRIPDRDVVEAVRQVAGSGLGERRWKTPGTLDWTTSMYDPEAIGDKRQHTFYGSDRDVFIFLVDDRNPICVGKTKDGHDDLMFRGFGVQNSEVGSRSLKAFGLYLRACCMNRNLWGVENFEEVTIRHTSMAPDRWLQQAMPALNSFAEGSAKTLIEGVEKAKAAKLANDQDEAMAFLKNRQFSLKAAQAILATGEEEEGRPVRSAWDFGQAITAFARSVPNTDARLQLELQAKVILDKVA